MIRFAGYLAQSDFGPIAKETTGPQSRDYVTNHAAIFRNCGAAALLSPMAGAQGRSKSDNALALAETGAARFGRWLQRCGCPADRSASRWVCGGCFQHGGNRGRVGALVASAGGGRSRRRVLACRYRDAFILGASRARPDSERRFHARDPSRPWRNGEADSGFKLALGRLARSGLLDRPSDGLWTVNVDHVESGR